MMSHCVLETALAVSQRSQPPPPPLALLGSAGTLMTNTYTFTSLYSHCLAVTGVRSAHKTPAHACV